MYDKRRGLPLCVVCVGLVRLDNPLGLLFAGGGLVDFLSLLWLCLYSELTRRLSKHEIREFI